MFLKLFLPKKGENYAILNQIIAIYEEKIILTIAFFAEKCQKFRNIPQKQS
jgi:hypothetical protein